MLRGSDVAPSAMSYLVKAILAVIVAVVVIAGARYLISKGIDVGKNTVKAGTSIDLGDEVDSNLNEAENGLDSAIGEWEKTEDIQGFGGAGSINNLFVD